jgi:hypothetical protein
VSYPRKRVSSRHTCLHERFEERESEKPLGDCHTGEEEEEAGRKPEFEAKVLLGNLRLWRPRVASWNLLCMHHRPPPNKCNLGLLWRRTDPLMQPTQYAFATYAICLMYINCPRVRPARKADLLTAFAQQFGDSHASGTSTISTTSQSRSVTPAATAGVASSV